MKWLICRGTNTPGTKGLFTWTRDSKLPRGNDCPGASVTSRSHDGLLCPGSTSLPQGKFIEIWSLRIYLNSFNFYTNCYKEWILNTFTYFWCFLELYIGKFILNINNEHVQDYSCPGATFAFCSHGEKLPRQGGLPGVVQRVTRLSKLPRGNEKLMWTFTGVRPCTEAKLTPGSLSYPGAMSCPGIMWTGPNTQYKLCASSGFLALPIHEDQIKTTNERTNVPHECMNARMHECTNAWMHEWMNAWMNEWMNASPLPHILAVTTWLHRFCTNFIQYFENSYTV